MVHFDVARASCAWLHGRDARATSGPKNSPGRFAHDINDYVAARTSKFLTALEKELLESGHWLRNEQSGAPAGTPASGVPG